MIFIYLVSLSELSSPADRLLSTGQGLVANCCQLLKISTTGSEEKKKNRLLGSKGDDKKVTENILKESVNKGY